MGKIIDVHVHVGDESQAIPCSPEHVLAKMDANGIDQSILSPIADYEDPRGILDSQDLNNLVADACRRWPDRFPRGFGVVEARHGEEALSEVDRVFDQLGLAGLMFHSDYSGISLDHPNVFAIMERASKYPNVIIMAHMFQHSILEAPFQLMRLADAFPNITFIGATPMMTTTDSSSTFYMAKKCPNIIFDTSWTHSHLWPIEKAVKEIGIDRMLFGSDNPYYTKSIDKLIIEWSNTTEAEKSKIFYENAKKLFSL
jgi:predicted TIM-barrel fold metal-dependent hydrolase